jgi:hypothetical protein
MDQDSIFNDFSSDVGTAQRLKPKPKEMELVDKPSIPTYDIVYDFDVFVFPVGLSIHSFEFTTVKQVCPS